MVQLSLQIKENLLRSQKGSLNERNTDEKFIKVTNDRESDYQSYRERKKKQQGALLRTAW